MDELSQHIQWLLRDKYSGNESRAFLRDVERLKAGEPVDYVIGWRPFLGLKIDVSKKPLIPRQETEYWVEKIIPHLKDNARILDIFSGSGCVGLALLSEVKNSHVVFADDDKNAILQIKKNLKLNNIKKERYKVIKSNIFSGIKGNFDYIVANPPYIPRTNKKKIQSSVLKHEPHKALFGGSDGLALIKKFLAKAPAFLRDGGSLYMEFDSFQKKEIEKLLKKYKYQLWEFHQDQFGKWRWLSAKK